MKKTCFRSSLNGWASLPNTGSCSSSKLCRWRKVCWPNSTPWTWVPRTTGNRVWCWLAPSRGITSCLVWTSRRINLILNTYGRKASPWCLLARHWRWPAVAPYRPTSPSRLPNLSASPKTISRSNPANKPMCASISTPAWKPTVSPDSTTASSKSSTWTTPTGITSNSSANYVSPISPSRPNNLISGLFCARLRRKWPLRSRTWVKWVSPINGIS